MNIPTVKKLYLLISIFIVGFISLFSMHNIFETLITTLDSKTINYENKMKIGKFISQDILGLEAIYYKLATTSSIKSRKNVNIELHTIIRRIENALKILEMGGTLKRVINLNIKEHDNTIENVKYVLLKPYEKSLEIIQIKKQLIEFKKMILKSNHLLTQLDLVKNTKYTKTFLISVKNILDYYKITPTFFTTMSGTIHRILHEDNTILANIKKDIILQKDKYMKLKIFLIVSIITLILLVGYWITNIIHKEDESLKKLNEELQNKELSVKAILNGQKNMVIVSDGKQVLNANDAIAEFFDKFDTVEDFTKQHKCICDMFEENVPNDSYIIKKDYNGLNWLEYILSNADTDILFKVIMNNGHEDHHFTITANKKVIDKDNNYIIVVTLNDITSEIDSQKQLINLNDNLELIVESKVHELQDLNDNLEQKVLIEANKARKKDKQMMQQARFAAMGEMIGNIAHQWRQPLSAINTTASGMQLQMQLNLASEDEIKDSYQRIMNYVDFLTQTIEDFRNFFHEDKEKIEFDIIEIIEKTISITSATYKDADITLLNTCSAKPMQSFGMPNELSQVFLNILTNAKDAIVSNNIKNRLVSIQCSQDSTNNIIMIQDNAEGIPTDIIEKIFDPYFTTKHQTQGTGIGLYMSKDIVENHMFGQISVKNVVTTIDNHTFNGACFKISIPRV